MRATEVYYNKELAGILTEESRQSFRFRYDDAWFNNDNKPPVSLTMPKTCQEYTGEYLFPFFFNMLSEGFNRKFQSKVLRIDENDYFGLLMATAQYDTIGAITLRPVQ
jgi:serine/threonine-protein kinase HipA